MVRKRINNAAFYGMSLERLSVKNKLESFLLFQVVYRISGHYAEVITGKEGLLWLFVLFVVDLQINH